jgi:4-carboxymuconolactone decarboxylase
MAKAPLSKAHARIHPEFPKLVELTNDFLLGEIWERPGLSKRDRSLITVAALTALGRAEQLTGHLKRALRNGVTREEIGELITHLAFYAGWPTAMTAARVARQVFEARR